MMHRFAILAAALILAVLTPPAWAVDPNNGITPQTITNSSTKIIDAVTPPRTRHTIAITSQAATGTIGCVFEETSTTAAVPNVAGDYDFPPGQTRVWGGAGRAISQTAIYCICTAASCPATFEIR